MVKELSRARDLSLHATKQMTRSIGHSMAALVVTERHLWLNLLSIKEKDKAFLLDALIAHTGNQEIYLLTPPPQVFRGAVVSSSFSAQSLPRNGMFVPL